MNNKTIESNYKSLKEMPYLETELMKNCGDFQFFEINGPGFSNCKNKIKIKGNNNGVYLLVGKNSNLKDKDLVIATDSISEVYLSGYNYYKSLLSSLEFNFKLHSNEYDEEEYKQAVDEIKETLKLFDNIDTFMEYVHKYFDEGFLELYFINYEDLVKCEISGDFSKELKSMDKIVLNGLDYYKNLDSFIYNLQFEKGNTALENYFAHRVIDKLGINGFIYFNSCKVESMLDYGKYCNNIIVPNVSNIGDIVKDISIEKDRINNQEKIPFEKVLDQIDELEYGAKITALRLLILDLIFGNTNHINLDRYIAKYYIEIKKENENEEIKVDNTKHECDSKCGNNCKCKKGSKLFDLDNINIYKRKNTIYGERYRLRNYHSFEINTNENEGYQFELTIYQLINKFYKNSIIKSLFIDSIRKNIKNLDSINHFLIHNENYYRVITNFKKFIDMVYFHNSEIKENERKKRLELKKKKSNKDNILGSIKNKEKELKNSIEENNNDNKVELKPVNKEELLEETKNEETAEDVKCEVNAQDD